MSLHVSMAFPTQISSAPGYTSWDDDTSALLNIAVSEVILPQEELAALSGGEGMRTHLFSVFVFCLGVELIHMLNAAYNVIVSAANESNGTTSESSPSASGIGSPSRTLPDSKGLRPANQAPSMHGKNPNNRGVISKVSIL